MNVGSPALDVLTGARGRLLAALAQFERPASILELATAADADSRHGGRIVDALLAAGIVTETRAGQARLVELNREHLAYEPIVALVGARRRLVDRLRAELESVDLVAGAWLFGSAARGDGDTGSDIDILLVSAGDLDDAEWDDVVWSLRTKVPRWTGNGLQLVEHSSASLARLVKGRNRLISEIRRDGVALVTRGAPLLRGAA
jgi:predicted nucleotidyltransferase